MMSGPICEMDWKQTTRIFHNLMHHVSVYELGERLLLPDLKAHAADVIMKDI